MSELKTSEEWQALLPDALVIDPDGWNRSNFVHSWFEEKISQEEYINRRTRSTCGILNKPQKTK